MLGETTHCANSAPPLTKPTLSEVRMAAVTLFESSADLKKCSKCGFPAHKFRAKRNLCQACHKEYHQEYYRKNKLQFKSNARKLHLKTKYQITIDDFEAMQAAQNGACAICLRLSEALNVDHCHKTGAVRGLLCWDCNTSIGKFRDDPEKLERAAKYLRGEVIRV